MSDVNLGSVPSPEAKRDAVHVAIFPCVAGINLEAGQRVGVVNGLATPLCDEHIGIVDPFMYHSVQRGQRFWLLMLPGTVTQLRHSWEHPSIPEDATTVYEDPEDDGCRGCW